MSTSLPVPDPTQSAILGYTSPWSDGAFPVAIRKSAIAWLRVDNLTRLREGADPNNIDPAVDLVYGSAIYGVTNGASQIYITTLDGDADVAQQWLTEHAAEWLS